MIVFHTNIRDNAVSAPIMSKHCSKSGISLQKWPSRSKYVTYVKPVLANYCFSFAEIEGREKGDRFRTQDLHHSRPTMQ